MSLTIKEDKTNNKDDKIGTSNENNLNIKGFLTEMLKKADKARNRFVQITVLKTML